MHTDSTMRRNRLETIYTILIISLDGIKKTHIMYKANLSHQQLEKYLETLLSKELLMKKSNSYATTPLGRAFIKEFKKIQSLMGETSKITEESETRMLYPQR